jgi:predicted TIM-barrel enzyme
VSGDISVDEYKSFKAGYEAERATLEERLPVLRRELHEVEQATGKIDEWMDLVASCVGLETLDRSMAIRLVDSIVVGERVKVDGKTTQAIEISYRFIGNLLSAAEQK